MEKDLSTSYLFKASSSFEDVFVNAKGSFGAEYIADARYVLNTLRSIPLSSGCLYVPSNYQEDLTQIQRRDNFSLTDWILLAVSVDLEDTPIKALLIHNTYRKEGIVVDIPTRKIDVCFFRGFSIKETADSKIMDEDSFLESIGVEKATYVPLQVEIQDEAPMYFEEDQDSFVIEVNRPAFEAYSKRKIVNYGGYSAPLDIEVEEDEDGELSIEVERTAFKASSGKRPVNLNATVTYIKPKKNKNAPEPVTPTFTASSGKKPMNLNATETYEKKKPVPVAHQEIVKPAFTASNGKKPRNLNEPKRSYKEEKTQSVVVTSIDQATIKPAEAPKVKPVAPAEEKKKTHDWKSENVYRLRPNVYKGERGLLANPKDAASFALCKVAFDSVKDIKLLPVSSKCLFVPEVLEDGDPHIKTAYRFDASKWNVLALSVDKEDKPVMLLLDNKEENGYCIAISMKAPEMIEVISLKGVALDDPALPYFGYEDLKRIVYGK